MNLNFMNFLKTAFKYAVFLLIIFEAEAAKLSFSSVKQNTIELLLQKKKSQALREIIFFIKHNSDLKNLDETNDFLVMVAQKFIFREAQEAYENSINLSLENIKEAIKSNEKCLKIEPQQLECLIQKTRLLYRAKDRAGINETITKIKEIVPRTKYDKWLNLILIKDKIEFNNKQIIRNLKDKNPEEWNGLILLELERCFNVKNYSCAKDILNFYEKNYSDWPDLLFYKYKLDDESAEEKFGFHNEKNSEQLVLYKNKCKALNKTTARKYRYDFDLCMREAGSN